MYERFTERAKKLIVHARTEAKRLNSDFVRTEHMLLGLVRERDGVAARALANLGVDLDDLQRGIEQQMRHGAISSAGDDIPFSPSSKKVLEYAIDEARKLNHPYVGTEHILLGLLPASRKRSVDCSGFPNAVRPAPPKRARLPLWTLSAGT